MRCRLPSSVLPLLLLIGGAASAETVVQRENVRYEYARVLRVTPVFQTLIATSMETRCEDEDSRLSKVVGAVRSALKRDKAAEDCRPVPVERRFQRPIAYDVDYTYRGARYRSRLPEDPGHLLRIRVSVMPMPMPNP